MCPDACDLLSTTQRQHSRGVTPSLKSAGCTLCPTTAEIEVPGFQNRFPADGRVLSSFSCHWEGIKSRLLPPTNCTVHQHIAHQAGQRGLASDFCS